MYSQRSTAPELQPVYCGIQSFLTNRLRDTLHGERLNLYCCKDAIKDGFDKLIPYIIQYAYSMHMEMTLKKFFSQSPVLTLFEGGSILIHEPRMQCKSVTKWKLLNLTFWCPMSSSFFCREKFGNFTFLQEVKGQEYISQLYLKFITKNLFFFFK